MGASAIPQRLRGFPPAYPGMRPIPRVTGLTPAQRLRAPCPGSGPELALEAVLSLVDGALVGTGGEVLPAAVGDHERDVGALAGLDRLRRLGERRVQDRAGRD